MTTTTEQPTIEILLDTHRYAMDPEGLCSDESFAANCEAYVDAVREAVQSGYPDSRVTVGEVKGVPGSFAVSGFDDNRATERNVREIQRGVWDRADFWIHE